MILRFEICHLFIHKQIKGRSFQKLRPFTIHFKLSILKLNPLFAMNWEQSSFSSFVKY